MTLDSGSLKELVHLFIKELTPAVRLQRFYFVSGLILDKVFELLEFVKYVGFRPHKLDYAPSASVINQTYEVSDGSERIAAHRIAYIYVYYFQQFS